jgi:hypothetical protein
VVVAVSLAYGWAQNSTPHPNPCDGPEASEAAGFVELGEKQNSAASALTALEAKGPLVVSFGDAKGIRSDVVVLEPVPETAVLHRTKPPADIKVGDVKFRAAIDGALEASGRASIQAVPRNGFGIHSSVTDGGNLVVCLQVDRTHLIEARSYTGNLDVTLLGRKRAVVMVTVESRAPREDAAWPAIVGFVFGLAIKLIAEAAAGGRGRKRDAFKRYVGSWAFTLDVTFGAIAVGWLVRSLYFQSATFGDSGDDPYVLAAAAAAAQLGASSIVDIGKKFSAGRGVREDLNADR